MSTKVTLVRQVPVELSPDDLAEAFCELDAEAQAAFFEGVASRAREHWGGAINEEIQWSRIGRLLGECRTDRAALARRMLREISSEAEGVY